VLSIGVSRICSFNFTIECTNILRNESYEPEYERMCHERLQYATASLQ